MSITLSALQQQRRDTAANWTSANPTLLAGEIGVETDTGLLKIGDGITAWTSLDYLPLSFEGYAANGIYNPAANQVALATNGTGRLFIDSSGNIGVGTSSPSVNLEVSSASYPQLRVTDSAASVSTKVMSTPTTGNIGTHTNHDLQIVTNNTERVRIDSSGRVGIGTSSPGNALNVVGSSATTNTGATVLVDDSASLAANIGGSIAFRGTDGTNTRTYGLIRGGKLDSSSGSFDGYLAFETRSNGQATTSEHLRITNAGNVGIGTSSPQYLLDVYKSTGTNQDVFAVRGQTSAFLIQCSDLSAANPIWNLRSFAAEDIAIKPGGTESVRFASSGRVGIGTSSPNASTKLHVAGSICVDNNSGLYGINSAATSAYRIFHIGGDNNVYINANPENNAVVIQSGVNSEAMRIDSSGRLLVGTSSDLSGGDADARLQVNGDAGAQILLSRQDFGALTAGTLIGEVVFRSQASGVKETSALIKCEADATQGSVDKPGRLVFSTTADGSGSPTERMRINSSGTVLIGGTAAIDSGVSLSLQAASSEDAAEIKVRTNGQNAIQFRNASNADVGKIVVNSSSTTYTISSDYRLKENVVEIADGITRVKQLQPRRFNFIADNTTTVDGFLAHEAQTVVPEAITGEKDAVDEDGNPVYQGIDQSKLVPLLTAALQEAIAKIETLEQRLTDAGL